MSHKTLRMMLLSALFAALTAVGAFIRLPAGPTSITLQFFFSALAGILLGPSVLNLLDDGLLAISGSLRKIALLIILARAGLTLRRSDLKKVGRPALLMCFVPFSVMRVILPIAYLLIAVGYILKVRIAKMSLRTGLIMVAVEAACVLGLFLAGNVITA